MLYSVQDKRKIVDLIEKNSHVKYISHGCFAYSFLPLIIGG